MTIQSLQFGSPNPAHLDVDSVDETSLGISWGWNKRTTPQDSLLGDPTTPWIGQQAEITHIDSGSSIYFLAAERPQATLYVDGGIADWSFQAGAQSTGLLTEISTISADSAKVSTLGFDISIVSEATLHIAHQPPSNIFTIDSQQDTAISQVWNGGEEWSLQNHWAITDDSWIKFTNTLSNIESLNNGWDGSAAMRFDSLSTSNARKIGHKLWSEHLLSDHLNNFEPCADGSILLEWQISEDRIVDIYAHRDGYTLIYPDAEKYTSVESVSVGEVASIIRSLG